MQTGLMRDTITFYLNQSKRERPYGAKQSPNYVQCGSLKCQIKKQSNEQSDNLDSVYYNNTRQVVTYNRFKQPEGCWKTIRSINDITSDMNNVIVTLNNDTNIEYLIADIQIDVRLNQMTLTLQRNHTIYLQS